MPSYHAPPIIVTLPSYPWSVHQHNGRLVAALYGGTSLSLRVKRLILSTLVRNPHYFTQLAKRIRATRSVTSIVTVAHAAKKTMKEKGVKKRHK